MPELNLNVDGLIFHFPENWNAVKFDEWAFYRQQFSRMRNGIKGVDILALPPRNDVLWMIEVKDFRINPRRKSQPLHEELWEKVFATLAALAAAPANANEPEEKEFAKKAILAERIRVIFHGAQPQRISRLFPASYDQANLQQKMRSIFKAIDPHARAVDHNSLPNFIPWTASIGQ